MPANPALCIEVCANSIASALAGQSGGADRIELCSALAEGGLTPSAATIEIAREKLGIGLNVLVRPRGGDFCYDEHEFAAMKRDIEFCKQAGVDGVVVGILLPDGAIDCHRTRELIATARPMSVTFHRAFDMASDPFRALDDILKLGADRLLTSGQQAGAVAGKDLIAQLVRRAGERLIVMPGAGVNENNIRELITATGAREFHLSGQTRIPSRMNFRNPNVHMGVPGMPEYEIGVTDAAKIRRVVEAARSLVI
jgi:copper homeostasis protein